MKSDFDKKKEDGISFGAARETYRKVLLKTKPYVQEGDIPGPGKYEISTFVEKIANDHRSFTIGKKADMNFGTFCFYLIHHS